MAKQRIIEERTQTQREIKRRHDDLACSMDAELDTALSAVDWDRRNAACKSFEAFTDEYLVGLMLEDSPSPKMRDVMAIMEHCLTESRPMQLLLGRGSGKTSITLCFLLYCLATGRRNFGVIVSHNHASSQQLIKDLFRAVVEPGTKLAADFPGMVLPFQLCTGSYRRRQLYKGQTTDIGKTASQITFATLHDADGNEIPGSGATIISKGISSGIRGLRAGPTGRRPDLIICDDLQDAEQANSPDQVHKLLDVLRMDVLNLGSKSRASVIMTATSIAPEDLTQQIMGDKQWRTVKFPALISWPKDYTAKGGLWLKYFDLYDSELADDKPHTESRAFYAENQKQLEEGAETFNSRYDPQTHVSTVHYLMDQMRLIGRAAFDSEYQQEPKRPDFKLDVSPRDVLAKRLEGVPRCTIPPGYVLTVASTDLNVSRWLTTVVCAFKPDGSCHVAWIDYQRCTIPTTIPQAEYNQRVFRELEKLQDRLLALNIKINCHAIDGSGIPFDAVTGFCKTTKKIPSCAFLGRASHIFNPYVRSRLRDPIGRTILCGDDAAHAGNPNGTKYVFWDADEGKISVQKAILAPVGSVGSLTVYDGDSKELSEFALQVCNEKLINISTKPDGRSIHQWRTRNPQDALDALAQARAASQQNNILGTGLTQATAKTISPGKAQLLQRLIRERRRTQFR